MAGMGPEACNLRIKGKILLRAFAGEPTPDDREMYEHDGSIFVSVDGSGKPISVIKDESAGENTTYSAQKVDELLSGLSPLDHNHDERYYTKEEFQNGTAEINWGNVVEKVLEDLGDVPDIPEEEAFLIYSSEEGKLEWIPRGGYGRNLEDFDDVHFVSEEGEHRGIVEAENATDFVPISYSEEDEFVISAEPGLVSGRGPLFPCGGKLLLHGWSFLTAPISIKRKSERKTGRIWYNIRESKIEEGRFHFPPDIYLRFDPFSTKRFRIDISSLQEDEYAIVPVSSSIVFRLGSFAVVDENWSPVPFALFDSSFRPVRKLTEAKDIGKVYVVVPRKVFGSLKNSVFIVPASDTVPSPELLECGGFLKVPRGEGRGTSPDGDSRKMEVKFKVREGTEDVLFISHISVPIVEDARLAVEISGAGMDEELSFDLSDIGYFNAGEIPFVVRIHNYGIGTVPVEMFVGRKYLQKDVEVSNTGNDEITISFTLVDTKEGIHGSALGVSIHYWATIYGKVVTNIEETDIPHDVGKRFRHGRISSFIFGDSYIGTITIHNDNPGIAGEPPELPNHAVLVNLKEIFEKIGHKVIAIAEDPEGNTLVPFCYTRKDLKPMSAPSDGNYVILRTNIPANGTKTLYVFESNFIASVEPDTLVREFIDFEREYIKSPEKWMRQYDTGNTGSGNRGAYYDREKRNFVFFGDHKMGIFDPLNGDNGSGNGIPSAFWYGRNMGTGGCGRKVFIVAGFREHSIPNASPPVGYGVGIWDPHSDPPFSVVGNIRREYRFDENKKFIALSANDRSLEGGWVNIWEKEDLQPRVMEETHIFVHWENGMYGGYLGEHTGWDIKWSTDFPQRSGTIPEDQYWVEHNPEINPNSDLRCGPFLYSPPDGFISVRVKFIYMLDPHPNIITADVSVVQPSDTVPFTVVHHRILDRYGARALAYGKRYIGKTTIQLGGGFHSSFTKSWLSVTYRGHREDIWERDRNLPIKVIIQDHTTGKFIEPDKVFYWKVKDKYIYYPSPFQEGDDPIGFLWVHIPEGESISGSGFFTAFLYEDFEDGFQQVHDLFSAPDILALFLPYDIENSLKHFQICGAKPYTYDYDPDRKVTLNLQGERIEGILDYGGTDKECIFWNGNLCGSILIGRKPLDTSAMQIHNRGALCLEAGLRFKSHQNAWNDMYQQGYFAFVQANDVGRAIKGGIMKWTASGGNACLFTQVFNGSPKEGSPIADARDFSITRFAIDTVIDPGQDRDRYRIERCAFRPDYVCYDCNWIGLPPSYADERFPGPVVRPYIFIEAKKNYHGLDIFWAMVAFEVCQYTSSNFYYDPEGKRIFVVKPIWGKVEGTEEVKMAFSCGDRKIRKHESGTGWVEVENPSQGNSPQEVENIPDVAWAELLDGGEIKAIVYIPEKAWYGGVVIETAFKLFLPDGEIYARSDRFTNVTYILGEGKESVEVM